MRFFVSLSFKGKAYSGWQIQNNALSVQAEIERALSISIGETIGITGAGRTDSGVNAICYIAHFDTSKDIKEPEKVLYKINAILPNDIVVLHLYRVAENAHARFDALSRTYEYRIHTEKDPFAIFSYFYKFSVDIDAMNKAAFLLKGTNDFSCFEKTGGGNSTSICSITEAFWSMTDENHYVFRVTADRFLRNMVRAIVGTLLEIGRGRKSPEWITSLIREKNRCSAGQSVPGEALFLTEIKYPYELKKIDNH